MRLDKSWDNAKSVRRFNDICQYNSEKTMSLSSYGECQIYVSQFVSISQVSNNYMIFKVISYKASLMKTVKTQLGVALVFLYVFNSTELISSLTISKVVVSFLNKYGVMMFQG